MGRFKSLLTRHWLITFTVMCISAFIFGSGSVDLFYLLRENLRLISNGDLLFDGALQELAELTGVGIISGFFYVLFKACEKALVEKLLK